MGGSRETHYGGAAEPRRTRTAPATVAYVRINNRQVAVPVTELLPTSEQQKEEAKQHAFRYALAHRALNALQGKQLEVIRRRYGFHGIRPMAFDEIADDLGMSLNTAYVHHHRAMAVMREALGVKRRGLQ